MRPGKPLMVGRSDTPMIGLPGNPVSTLVCALLFVKPAIERMLGQAGDEPAADGRAARASRSSANDRARTICAPGSTRGADGSAEVEPFSMPGQLDAVAARAGRLPWSSARPTPRRARPATPCRSSTFPLPGGY